MDQNAYFEKGLAIVRRLNECTYEAFSGWDCARSFDAYAIYWYRYCHNATPNKS